MTTERLHFMVESPANFVRLACTILFEKKEAMAEWAATWHDVFDCANGEQLFLQFMEELFPDGCTIGEKELKQITDRAVRYLQTETRCLDLKAGHDSLLSPFTEILADMYPACLHFGRKLHISGVFSDFR